MYKPVKMTGDVVAVPQLLFSRLGAVGADDGRFRVALYLLGSKGGADIEEIATALRLPRAQVESALHYWEGAGLIEQEQAAQPAIPVMRRRVLNTREAVRAGEADPALAVLLGEVQRLFGAVIGESDVNLFVTLYAVDKYPVDLILMATVEAVTRGVKRARYIEKILQDWRSKGIDDCAAADRYLKQLAAREERERKLAGQMGLAWDPFTLADKRKIAQWFEEYGYDFEMVEAARMAAGERQNEVKYLAGVLKKWHGKGYTSPKEVQQAGEIRNLRVSGGREIAPEEDLLAQTGGYVPLNKTKK